MFLMASFNTLKLSYKKLTDSEGVKWNSGFFGKVVKLSGPFSALAQTN